MFLRTFLAFMPKSPPSLHWQCPWLCRLLGQQEQFGQGQEGTRYHYFDHLVSTQPQDVTAPQEAGPQGWVSRCARSLWPFKKAAFTDLLVYLGLTGGSRCSPVASLCTLPRISQTLSPERRQQPGLLIHCR